MGGPEVFYSDIVGSKTKPPVSVSGRAAVDAGAKRYRGHGLPYMSPSPRRRHCTVHIISALRLYVIQTGTDRREDPWNTA